MTQDKTQNRNHVKWPNSGQTGRGNTGLLEPVPAYLGRKGDKAIYGANDNNATIILGRDRNPFGPPRSRIPHGSEEDPNNPKSSSSEVSGFSDYMGAGAIDIVVGRGAPFALELKKHGMFPAGLPPLYVSRDPDGLAGKPLTGGNHPGVVMDAARIYISQMCQVDDYFKIKKPKTIFDKNKTTTTLIEEKGPCSAIMLKADKLRLHSRRDVYIIAGGDHVPAGSAIDSNNNAITESGKIHLISKNGQDPSIKGASPAVRYVELRDCLKEICTAVQDVLEIVNSFAFWQMKLNSKLSNTVLGTAVGITTCNPINQAMEKITKIANMKDLLQIHAMKSYNIPKIETNYLTDGGDRWIASRNVTLN